MKGLHHFRLLFLLFVVLATSACGGGGGGGGDSGGSSGPGFSISTNTINFSATSPSSNVQPVVITGTVTGEISGTLFVIINVSGQAVDSVSQLAIDGVTNTGTATVFPPSAASLGEGNYSGTITITVCLNDPGCNSGQLNGSPQMIDINYTIGPAASIDVVMPGTVTSDSSGMVIIRGEGFLANNPVDQVAFGANSATSFTVISDTEIHAEYPVLAADSYPVNLSKVSGPVSFTAQLYVVDSISFSNGALSYPNTPQQTLGIVYEAKQQALFVAASYFDGFNFNTASRQGNQILRYQFSNGAFVSMASVTVPLLQDITLTPNGNTLLALTDTEVIEINPVNLAILSTTTRTGQFISNQYMKNIVMTNDGNALITTGLAGSGSTPILQYSLQNPAINSANLGILYNGTTTASADGSRAVLIEGSLSPAQPIVTYNSSTNMATNESATFNQVQCINSGLGTCIEPAVNDDGTLTGLIGGALDVLLYDQDFNLLGSMPGSYGAAIFSKDSSMLYAYGADSQIHTFDLTQTPVAGEYAESGTGTSLMGNPGNIYNFASETNVIRMTSTPDGNTLFIAGENLIAIQAAP